MWPFKKLDNIGYARKFAKKYGWEEVQYSKANRVIAFTKGVKKDKMRINVYFTTMTVGTCLNHPTKGKTQMFRKGVDMKSLEKLFKNPRIHTDKGYYENKDLLFNKK